MNMEAKDFRDGMKVTCEINGEKFDDAKLSQDSDGDWFICQNIFFGTPTNDQKGYDFSWPISYHGVPNLSSSTVNVTNLQPAKKQSKANPKEEVTVDYDGTKYDRHGFGKTYTELVEHANSFLAYSNRCRAMANRWLKYAKRYGWEVK